MRYITALLIAFAAVLAVPSSAAAQSPPTLDSTAVTVTRSVPLHIINDGTCTVRVRAVQLGHVIKTYRVDAHATSRTSLTSRIGSAVTFEAAQDMCAERTTYSLPNIVPTDQTVVVRLTTNPQFAQVYADAFPTQP